MTESAYAAAGVDIAAASQAKEMMRAAVPCYVWTGGAVGRRLIRRTL